MEGEGEVERKRDREGKREKTPITTLEPASFSRLKLFHGRGKETATFNYEIFKGLFASDPKQTKNRKFQYSALYFRNGTMCKCAYAARAYTVCESGACIYARVCM